jgi:hypothetical protein
MSMFARLSVSSVLAAGLCLVASAQDPPQSGESKSSAVVAEFPFEGEVTCENLNVRLAPKTDAGAAVVAVLRQGEKVVAVGTSGEFFVVRPPRGASVWIFGKHVKRESDGAGTVLVNDAAVRIDSRSNAEKLGALKEGERVTILKEHLGWFQIAAPEAVKYYVAKKYVRFLQPAAGPVLPKGPEAEPKGTADEAALAKLREAEGIIDQQNKLIADKKFSDVDWGGVVAALEEAVALAKTEPVKRQAENDLRIYKRIDGVFRPVMGNLEAAEKLLSTMRAINDEKWKKDQSKFEACGYVDTVGPLFHKPGTHKLVMSGKIIAFLRSNDEEGRIRLNNLFGKYIGVNGSVLKDPEGWPGHKVVTVEVAEEITKK